MFCILKTKKIHPAYVSKLDLNREKLVIILMIPNIEVWHYLAVNKLSVLLRGITSEYHGDFCYLNCLHSFTSENKRESLKRVCEKKDFSNIATPSADKKTLEFNHNKKFDKEPFITYTDLERLIEKIYGCKSNPENSFTTKVSEHIPSDFSMSTISSFRSIENNHDVYTGKDCI